MKYNNKLGTTIINGHRCLLMLVVARQPRQTTTITTTRCNVDEQKFSPNKKNSEIVLKSHNIFGCV